jgi:hypothetical protein
LPGGWWAFANDDASRAEKTVGQFVAALKLLDDVALRMFNGHGLTDGFMKIRVKWMAGVSGDFLQAEFFEGASKLAMHLLNALNEGGLVALFLRRVEGAFEVVERRQQRRNDALGSEAGQFLFFAGNAFAVIVEVGGGAKESIPILIGFGGGGLEAFEFGRRNRGRLRRGRLVFGVGTGRRRFRMFVFRAHKHLQTTMRES